ncbi:hypothetical protein RST01_02330 [Rummeliibacillus stabekisii]|nr:hypothetical protein RST01_02330 [Rummeliibacillus stabekisii]
MFKNPTNEDVGGVLSYKDKKINNIYQNIIKTIWLKKLTIGSGIFITI